MDHETERAVKRHKTQQYYVQIREQELEDRRQHCKTTSIPDSDGRLLTPDQTKKSRQPSKLRYLCSTDIDWQHERRQSTVQQAVARVKGFMRALPRTACSLM